MPQTAYAELFRTESAEHLAAVERLLLELEGDPSRADALEALFRSVHTLKGMAAAMGHAAVAELAHGLESVLDGLRQGRQTLDADTSDLLFRAADALEMGLAGAAESGGVPDLVSSVAAELRSCLADLPVPAAAPAGSAVLAPERTAAAATEDPAAAERGALRVRVVVAAGTPLPGVRAFMVLRRARELGRVGECVPPEAEHQDTTFRGEFGFRLATAAAPDEVRAALLHVGDLAHVEAEADASEPPTISTAPVLAAAPPTQPERQVRVDAARLDAVMGRVGELAVLRDRLGGAAGPEPADQAARLISELREEVARMRMVPVREVFGRFPRLVRDAARAVGKRVELCIQGEEMEVDRALAERIADPLVHLLRNAVDHGIESPAERIRSDKPEQGRIRLSAERDRDWVLIRVSDDGRGIDRERVLRKAAALGMLPASGDADASLVEWITRPGLSTAERVTQLSGRGVGLDAVAAQVRGMGGSLEVVTEPGAGSTFTLRVPAAIGLIRALLVACGGSTYLMPVTHVVETMEVRPGDLRRDADAKLHVTLRGGELPLIDLRGVLRADTVERDPWISIVIAEVDKQRIGIRVEKLLGQQEAVTYPFVASPGTLPVFAGATILPDGSPALILDVAALVHAAHVTSKHVLTDDA